MQSTGLARPIDPIQSIDPWPWCRSQNVEKSGFVVTVRLMANCISVSLFPAHGSEFHLPLHSDNYFLKITFILLLGSACISIVSLIKSIMGNSANTGEGGGGGGLSANAALQW